MRTSLLVVLLGAGAAAADPAPKGLAVGAEAGQPTAGVLAWSTGLVGVDAAVGSGVVDGHGLYLEGAITLAPLTLSHGKIPIYVGAGARRYDDHFNPMSIDEIPDVHVGVEGLVGVGFAMASGLEVLVRGGGGWDVARTDSCTLMSGVYSVCPHQQSSRAYWTAALALRFWLKL